MELEQLIEDVKAVTPKTGFSERLKTVRSAVNVNGSLIKLESVDFANHEDHSNHMDVENSTRGSQPSGKLLKLKTITLKAVSEICGHTDHSDHNDFTDTREV